MPVTKPIIALIDRDDFEKERALYKFKYEMAIAEQSIRTEGIVSETEVAKKLGVKL